jgi:hypothetical protein
MRLCPDQDVRVPAVLAGVSATKSPRGLLNKRPLAAAATAVLLATSFPGLAAELFVSTAGNDSSGNGTLQSPYRTIKRAISKTAAGDTVTIRGPSGNRTYNECDVRLRHPLVLRSYPGEQAHIHCDVSTPDSVTVQIDPNASGSRLSNLEISGGRYYGVMLQTNWYQGGPSSNHGARDVVLEDLLIHHTGRDGIKITPKSNNATIRRVEIHSTGAAYPAGTPQESMNADGIDNVNGSGMLVEDSYIHNTATTGLYFKGGAEDVVIQRNRIENTLDAGILVGFDTSLEFFDLTRNPGYYEAIRGTVRNNFVRNTGYSGIGMYASRDSVVANNTIVNAATRGHAPLYFGVTFQDWDPNAGRPANRNPTLRNNLVIQDSGRCVEIRYSGELGGLSGLEGSLNSDYNGFTAGCRFRDSRPGSNLPDGSLAQWRSTTGADANSLAASFAVSNTGHLPAGSPAIDRGVALSNVFDDIDGQARPARYDIGADEYMGSTPPPTTPPPTTSPPTSPAPPMLNDRTKLRDVSNIPRRDGPRPDSKVNDRTPSGNRPDNPGRLKRPTGGANAEAAQDVQITSPASSALTRFQEWLRS